VQNPDDSRNREYVEPRSGAAQARSEDFERLHGLISGTEDTRAFLEGMTGLGSLMMTRNTGVRIECAVSLHQRKRAITIAGSSDTAIILDGIEQRLGDGPSLLAGRERTPVLLARTPDPRWPKYSQHLADAGYSSVLGVPLTLADQASAALSFFAPTPGVLTPSVIEDARVFTATAGHALRLTLRIATADRLAEDLRAAMGRRTPIDVACGIIMA
jgi:hypothetical protein